MYSLNLWLILSLCCVGALSQSKGYYTISAPRVLRPNSEYHVAVSIQGTSQPTRVLVEVGGKQDSGGIFDINQETVVPPYSTQVVKLQISDLGPGTYNLTAKGFDGLDFLNTTSLEYVHKSYSVFIQTDKAIYKPGHKVLFRAIVLNSHLKPTVSGALDVTITDGKHNRVKQWNRALTTKGVFSGELQLSEHPVLGDWQISVNLLDQVFTKTFQVAEYVLPKFEVIIDAPDHATFKDSKIATTIRAKYTYGKPVKGEATVTIYPLFYSGFIQPIFETPFRKVVPIDGKAVVDFDIVSALKLTDDFERSVQIDVTVEESLTGRKQNNTAQVVLHKYKYKMELEKTSECFKPGLKYTAFLKLFHHDGTPVQDDTNPIIVKHGYTWETEKYNATKYKVPKNGILELEFFVNDPNATTLGIEATYLDLTEWFSTISPAKSPSDTFIQVILKTGNPKVNSDVELEVNSTAPLSYFNYEVIGRGDVLVANTVNLREPSKTYQFRFLATFAMAPVAHVLVHYVTDKGEVIVDSLQVEIDGALQNFVKIDASPSEVEPGRSIELSIEAKPNSYVGVLGVDQSVLLLKSGNDISHDMVRNELSSYDPAYVTPFLGGSDLIRFRRSFRMWWPGQATAHKVIENAGTVMLTNAYVYEFDPSIYYRSNFDNFEVMRAESAAPGAGAFAFAAGDSAGGFSEPPRVRSNFPETWLWESIDSGDENHLRAENRPRNRPILRDGVQVVKPDLGPAVAYASRLRPPLAGPYAFSRIPVPHWHHPRVFPMKDVASTWLFANVTSGYDGRATLKPTVPDTITSWVITGFSVDPVYGFGLIEQPQKVKVFRPFFVSLDLPYSVIRGEVVSIPIVVFNYLNKDLIAEVTLKNEGEFEFADVSNDINDVATKPGLELFRKKTVTVKANSGASTSFMITPRALGYISIKVSATSPLAGDAVDKKLLVKAEGETQYRNKAVFVDLRNQKDFTQNITLDIPKNFVVGSEQIEVSAVGDIMGPSIPNLQNLLKMPYGCGEQNMLNLVPNIVVMEYLTNTRQLTPAIQSKAMRFLETGYQQELTYRRHDGSFSAFGMSDMNGSTWLTAFVAKSFRQAMPYISIEDRVIQDALSWLENNQAPNGSFPEIGQVSHSDMQGGAAKGLALTAFTLIAFLENQKSTTVHRNAINKAVDYIARNMEGLDDPYAIAISSYALHLADHPAKNLAFNLLENKSESKGDMKWWMKSIPPAEEKNPWYSLPNGVNVEMTAYALLTYLERGLLQDAFPIMKWMVTQRNEFGGFASTQDTVIGIYSLSKLAERISSSNVNMQVNFNYNTGSSAQTTININPQKSMILQKNELPRKVRELQISATGTGFAVVQVSYQYNLNVTGAWPLFTLDPQVDKNSNNNHLQMTICSGFIGTRESNDSNMAVMEVTLPSGYTIDRDSLPSLSISQNVKRVETKDGDSVIMMYFDKMNKTELCPTISAYRIHKVANQKPVPVTIYDYYDSSRRARAFYAPLRSTVCDICDDEDCSKACSSRGGSPYSGNQRSGVGSGTSNLRPYALTSLPLIALIPCLAFLTDSW